MMNLKPRPLTQAILAAFSGSALADYNVTVTPGISANGAWSGGSPDVWTPTATGASVSVSEINTRLAAGTPVSITTAGSGAETGNDDGTITAKLLGVIYKLAPDYALIPAPAEHAKDAWWLDGRKVYVKTSDGKSAQGFGVK